MSKKVDFTFSDVDHIGKLNGEIIPSVTQLITEHRIVDYSMVEKDRLEYKRVLGIAVDYACDLWEKDNLDESSLHEEIKPYFEAYKKFRLVEKHDVDLEKSLCRVYSKKWRFHGSPDIVYRINDSDKHFGLIDRKCTWTLYPSGRVQVYMYKMLLEEYYKIKVVELGLLQLKGTGNYEYEPVKDKTLLQDAHAMIYLHWRKRNQYNIKEPMYFKKD